MRILLLIALLFVGTINAKPRRNLRDCEAALKSCLSCNDIKTDTIVIYSGKGAVKVSKQTEKTKRKADVQATKIVKDNNKTEVKTDKFLNFMQSLTRITAILTAGGFFAAGGAGLKLLQTLKEKVPFLSFLPV